MPAKSIFLREIVLQNLVNSMINKVLLLSILSSLLVLNIRCSNKDNSQKAESILEDYINAIGGRTKITSIKSYESLGDFYHDTVKMSYRTYVSFPDKIKIETKRENYEEVSVYNKGTAKSKINDSIFNITNLVALNSYGLDAYILPLAHLDQLGKKIEFIQTIPEGKEMLDEIFIEFKNGLTWNVFFNSNTHLIHHIKTSTGFEIFYLKHEPVEGVIFPTTFSFQVGKSSFRLFIHKIFYNFAPAKEQFIIH